MTPAQLEALTSWHAPWKGLRAVVLGASVTGFSVADTLTELGADVLVVTETVDPDRQKLLDVIGARTWVGPLDAVPDVLTDNPPDVIIASPGFAPYHPVVQWARDTGCPLWGDLELAWRVRDKVRRADGTPADWVLITGTNGKTTTTRMAATIMVEAGMRAAPCGNIGVPVLDAVRDPGGFDVLVVEVSSHQLWYLGLQVAGADPVSPAASVCLNLADDHLVWHGSVDSYRDAKAVVYQNTRIACVYNRADEATRIMVEDAEVVEGARAIGFGLDVPGPSDLGIVDGILVDRAFLAERRTTARELTTVDDLAEHGLGAPHVVANALAAAAVALALDAQPVAVRDGLARFELDPHRIHTVAVTDDGVRWVDDSKATNPHAAASSLAAFPGSIWIVGGLLKGIDISALIAGPGRHVKAAVVIGADRDPVVAAFARHAPEVPVFEVASADTGNVMTEAVTVAAQQARDGDVVLLAPAAASFDQFESYTDRGEQFAHAVRDRAERSSGGDNDTSEPFGGAG